MGNDENEKEDKPLENGTPSHEELPATWVRLPARIAHGELLLASK